MLGRSADAPPVGIVIASGAALVTAAAFVAAAIPATAPAIRLGVLAMALAGYAAWTVDPRAVAAVTGLAALVCNGFLLAWHGRRSSAGGAERGRRDRLRRRRRVPDGAAGAAVAGAASAGRPVGG
jgi:hypothetical protein